MQLIQQKPVVERSIGAILVDNGRLTPIDAEKVLREQKLSKLRFGDAAIKLGLLTQSDIDFALARQFAKRGVERLHQRRIRRAREPGRLRHELARKIGAVGLERAPRTDRVAPHQRQRIRHALRGVSHLLGREHRLIVAHEILLQRARQLPAHVDRIRARAAEQQQQGEQTEIKSGQKHVGPAYNKPSLWRFR